MSQVKDITNKKFGRWTVIGFFEVRNNNSYWKCICDCGNEKTVKGNALRSGKSKSCGCYNKDRVIESNLIDIAGNRYGDLVVLGYRGVKNRVTKWECLCDCGNSILVNGSDLKRYHTTSCGCSKKGLGIVDISGNKYGMITVLKFYERKNNMTFWECECECGTKKIINGNSLKSGDTTSCGCLNESYIASELKKYFTREYSAIAEYSELKNISTGKNLLYDLYLPNEKIFVEVNGVQHYKFVPYYHRRETVFEYQKKKDRIKRKYARKNGIYVEIDLRKTRTKEEWISYVESFILGDR